MTLVPLTLPPGVYRNGTEDQSSGRYYDSNLVRWTEGTLRPMGGWTTLSQSPVTGKGRAILTWRDNEGNRWAAIGTHSNLYIMDRLGQIYDITPSGLTVGAPVAPVGGGYGGGDFGAGDYGAPGMDPGLIGDATVWSLDTFGENLVALNNADGSLYQWTLDTSSAAVVVSAAPVNNRALVVTEERFALLLGAAGNPRLVQWADQESLTAWTPDPTIQAGNFPLQSRGRLMCGARIRGGTLLFTDQEAYLATYQGAPLIYGFQRIGEGCGIISQGAACVGGDAVIAWMGAKGFWTFDGYAEPLACDVSDYVFGDLNRNQVSLITVTYSPSYGEITWFYPSSGSSENDRYVRWNHRENHWAIGQLSRTAGIEEGVFTQPFMVGPDGDVFAHETGFDYDGAVPFAETSPIEMGNGDRVFTALSLIPDERTVGDVVASFITRFQPTAPAVTYGPYTATSKTDIRFTARQARMRLQASIPEDFRVGTFKIDITLGGLR